MNSLHRKVTFPTPATKNKSVWLTEEGASSTWVLDGGHASPLLNSLNLCDGVDLHPSVPALGVPNIRAQDTNASTFLWNVHVRMEIPADRHRVRLGYCVLANRLNDQAARLHAVVLVVEDLRSLSRESVVCVRLHPGSFFT